MLKFDRKYSLTVQIQSISRPIMSNNWPAGRRKASAEVQLSTNGLRLLSKYGGNR